MRPALSFLVALTLATACTAADDVADPAEEGDAGGKADELDGVVDAEFGLDARPSNTTCVAPDRPRSDTSVTTQRVFPNLTFAQPVGMIQAPGSTAWYVIEKAGRVRTFPNTSSTTNVRTFVDIRSIVESDPNEMGLLGMAFHPRWQENHTAYLSFNMRDENGHWSVLTRIRSTDGGQTLDTSTHELLFSVQQPFVNHNGGQIEFGPDGFLYMALGDGGSANDPHGNGQNTNTTLGKLLRIDVDRASGGRPYAIPSDNRFANGGGRPEIYAFGLRNPWRFSWDRATGELWLADVGQDRHEEVNIIERGGNYGWRLKEGFACFGAPSPCSDLPVIDPIHTYDHSNGDRSITGGYVYRGDDIPGLEGAYIFGDIVTGRVWGLFPTAEGWKDELLIESGIQMATFAQDRDGEIYLPNFADGTIHKLVAAGGGADDDFPRFLSDTGCFQASDPRLPAGGMIPYDVASPLWSDGAEKERFMAIPSGSRIEMQQDGDFVFPIGTVLAKTFFLHGKRVETRLLMRHPDGGWGGYAYKWNSAQTDAELLAAGEVVEVGGDTWQIPSRADCTACHTAAAGVALGPEFLQLNTDFVYASTKRRSNQMETLAHIGLFSNLADDDFDAREMPRLHGIDDDASLEDRARSYLHSNCSNCHRPGGPGRSDADMRFLVPFDRQAMCNAMPDNALGLSSPRLVKPGDPEGSVIVHRMAALDASRMPALGSRVVDEDAVGLMSAWIADLSACP